MHHLKMKASTYSLSIRGDMHFDFQIENILKVDKIYANESVHFIRGSSLYTNKTK